MMSFNVQSQDTLLPPESASKKIKRNLTRDCSTLASALLEGTTTEKERFDVLFTWVVNNIGYDYRLYNSGKANNANNPLKRVLRRKKGVCTDIARLMDTLCAFAGIESATIEGYVKERVFDLNDTLYFDNHAWNAVKLGGNWYLYDATWSSGGATYDYTRFGKWRLRQIQKLYTKAKKKTRRLILRGRKSRLCGETQPREIKSVEVLVLPFVPRVLINALTIFPFRIKEQNRYVWNTNYYLAQPEVFAIDHFPNTAAWSLQSELKTVVDFSADSAYYYRTADVYRNQKREGKTCLACEEIHFKDEIGKEKYKISKSFENNPKNHLLPAISYLRIAAIFEKAFYNEEDSLTKMALFDSTRYYLDECKRELRNTRKDNSKNLRFQLKKNKTKKTLLLQDNKKHWSAISRKLKDLGKRKTKIKSLDKKLKLYKKRGIQDIKKLHRSFERKSGAKPLKKEQEERIRAKLYSYSAQSDSLSEQIKVLEDGLEIHLPDLWENLVEEINALVPLLSLVEDDSWYRCNLLDQYDRQIREIRTQIDAQEVLVLERIDRKLLQLSDKAYDEFMTVNRLIKKRNILDAKAAKQVALLNAGGSMANDSLNLLKDQWKQRMREDVCWNDDNEELINAIIDNFYDFFRQNKSFSRILRNNDALERSRAIVFDKHNRRNSNRVNNVIKGNARAALQIKKNVYDHRNAFLQKLRKERAKG